MAIRTASKAGTCSIIVVLIVTLAAAGQYGAISCPMAASSRFRQSPGNAASGDALHIVSVHRHGHRNGPQRRYIRSPPLPILTSNINLEGFISLFVSYWPPPTLEGFISLFVSYWPPPTTMEAVSATIVAGGRARIRLNIEVSRN